MNDETQDQASDSIKKGAKAAKKGARTAKRAVKNVKRTPKVVKAAAKVAVKAGQVVAKLAVAFVHALVALWPLVLGLVAFVLIYLFLTGFAQHYYDEKSSSQDFQTEDIDDDNERSDEFNENGYHTVASLSNANKLVKAYYTFYSDKSFYALVGDDDYLYNGGGEDFEKLKVKDKYDKEKSFYLSPEQLFTLDEFLNEQELRSAEQFVHPVPFEKKKDENFENGYAYSLKEITGEEDENGETPLTIKSAKYDKEGNRTTEKTEGVWDYGFAPVLHYQKYKEEFEQRGYKIKTQKWNKEKQKFETVNLGTEEREAVAYPQPSKESYLIDQVVSAAGGIRNKIKHDWVDTGNKWEKDKTETVSVEIKKIRPIPAKNEKGEQLYYQADKNGNIDWQGQTTEKNDYPIMVAESYYEKEDRDMVESYSGTDWEKVPSYDGEPDMSDLTGAKYYIDYIQNYVNYVPEDVMSSFNLKDRLGMGDEEIQKLLDDEGESGDGTSSVDISGLKLGENASGEDYKRTIKYIDIFKKYGEKYGIDPYILVAMACGESSGTLDAWNGYAFGLMQCELTGIADASGYRTLSAVDVQTGQIETDKFSKENMRGNADMQIKAGAMELQAAFRNPVAKNNLMLSLMGYNQGFGGLGLILSINGDNPLTAENLEAAATTYKNQTGKGTPEYARRVLRYYASPDDKSPWFIGTDNVKHAFDDSSLSMGSVDSVNSSTIAGNTSVSAQNLWSKFTSKISQAWVKAKSSVKEFFGISADSIDYKSMEKRERFEKDWTEDYAIMTMKQMFAYSEAKNLQDYDDFTDDDFKSKFKLLFSNPLGKIQTITPEKIEKNEKDYFPKGYVLPIEGSIKIIGTFGSTANGDKDSVIFNNGADIEVTANQEIKAVADGEVMSVNKSDGLISISTTNGVIVYYRGVSNITVREGQKVKKGAKIAAGTLNLKKDNTFNFALFRNTGFEDPAWMLKKDDILSGGNGTGDLTFPTDEPIEGDVAHLLEVAKKYLGVPYVWGGKTPSGFDCSGFVGWVFKEAWGKEVTTWTGTQCKIGKAVSYSDMQPGDMILYDWGGDGMPDHVAIYIGGGKQIHAPKRNDVVKIANISRAPDYIRRVQ